MRMTMARRGDRVATVQIKISVAAARVDPNTVATLRDDRHFLVRRELEPLLSLDRLLQLVKGVHKILTRTFTTKALRHKAINPAQPIPWFSLCDYVSCVVDFFMHSNPLASTPSSHSSRTSDSC